MGWVETLTAQVGSGDVALIRPNSRSWAASNPPRPARGFGDVERRLTIAARPRRSTRHWRQDRRGFGFAIGAPTFQLDGFAAAWRAGSRPARRRCPRRSARPCAGARFSLTDGAAARRTARDRAGGPSSAILVRLSPAFTDERLRRHRRTGAIAVCPLASLRPSFETGGPNRGRFDTPQATFADASRQPQSRKNG